MKIFKILLPAFILSTIILISCQKDVKENGGPGQIRIFLTDHQTPVFDSVFIDIQKLEVKVEDDSTGNDGWVTLAIRTGVYNILRFRNGIDTLFGTGTLPNTRIRKLRLTLGTQNSVMKDGISTPLKVHDNDREVVANLESSNFEIGTSGEVLFWIDFDAGRSIQPDNSGSGSGNGYRLKSHIKIFTKRNSGRLEGRVLPRVADPIVKVIQGSDTTTAIPESDGEFKVMGLSPGTYKVLFDGRVPYIDTIINNVIIRAGEDTHLPTITLRQ